MKIKSTILTILTKITHTIKDHWDRTYLIATFQLIVSV